MNSLRIKIDIFVLETTCFFFFIRPSFDCHIHLMMISKVFYLIENEIHFIYTCLNIMNSFASRLNLKKNLI